jgi:CTP-dependent riboflavin kinase
MVSDKLWMHPEIEFFDLGLWCALTFAARGQPETAIADAKLAEMLEVSVPTIQRGLKRLERASFIERQYNGEVRTITIHPEGNGEEQTFGLRIAKAG